LDTQTVAYGLGATAPDAPSREPDAQYSYGFTGWDKAFDNITGDLIVTAQYSETTNSYTVTFKDWDGEVLDTQTVAYGLGATAPDAPSREPDAQYSYGFTGWDKAFDNITGDLIVTAQYSETTRSYTVKWVDGNGNTIYTEDLEFGATPVYDVETYGIPEKAATTQHTYTFDGWSPPVGEVGKAVTYVAQFLPVLRSYEISWDTDGDGIVDDSAPVAFGTVPTHADGAKAADDVNFYNFIGWFPDVEAVSGPATYKALFDSVPRTWAVDVDDVDFGTIDKGDLPSTLPEYIIIKNNGNSPVEILSVTVIAGGSEDVAFEIDGPEESVPMEAGDPCDAYSIRPKAGLAAGSYTQTIVVEFVGGETLEAMASVTIGVNDPAPVANNDIYTVKMNGTLEGNVLDNDTDVDNDPLTAIIVDGPAHAADDEFVLNADGSFTYVPERNFVGTDTFTYKAYDGNSYSNEATVTITVSSQPYTTLTGPSPAIVRLGNEFTVKYALHNVLNVNAQDVTLSYDPAIFAFMGLAAEDGIFAVLDHDEDAGEIRVILANVDPLLGDAHEIFTATFKAIGKAESSEIALTEAEVASAEAPGAILEPKLSSLTIGTADPSALEALIDEADAFEDGTTEGIAAGQYPKGSKAALRNAIAAAQSWFDDLSATQAQLDAAEAALRSALNAFKALERTVMIGDFNGNGVYDIGDLAVFVAHYGEEGADAYHYDLNQDGIVDMADLTLLMTWILG
ncbi:MAG: cadherin-like domain-containing protein, partial [Clostridiales bacterium]|nr:cadherin-like domain-containing protein [Clostridiales bacterium]